MHLNSFYEGMHGTESTEISVYDYITLTKQKGERAKHMDVL